MRELEFIPAWYIRLLRRRRLLFVQSWLALAIAGGLGLWVFLADGNARAAEAALDSLRHQVQQTESQLEQMDRLEKLRKQWRRQADVMDRMGLHVESARLISKLAEVMPKAVAITMLHLEVRESPMALSNAARAALRETAPLPMDRRLHVQLHGVAPTDLEIVTLITELNRVPFFHQVTPSYARDRRESGHVLREFELTFEINLNPPTND
jgi:hypothetical protein